MDINTAPPPSDTTDIHAQTDDVSIPFEEEFKPDHRRRPTTTEYTSLSNGRVHSASLLPRQAYVFGLVSEFLWLNNWFRNDWR